MAAGFYGEIVIRITADTAGLQKGLGSAAAQTEAGAQKIGSAAKKTGAHWERAGLAMQNMGRTMTQFVTLPVVAGLAVATVAGYRYEKTLLKLKNLTGLTAAETAKYGEAMKKLGPSVGVGPQALAEAMYFVTSSGFKAAEALKVVTLSAKASASGMGDVQVITDAVTSAMNSFGHENLSAARAIDIMMKTIQVGKAEPEALATSLGRIMPVAAQLGVEFNQLGGMIAGLTLGGLSAAEAVTSLRGSMFALVAPGKQAAKEMAHWGLSVGQIKRIVRDEGLLEALQLMYEKTGGNELAMKRMIPNVRALNGVLSMLGPNYKNTQRTIDEVTNSQGKLNEAFKETEKSAVFRMDRAIASIKASFTDIGQALLPAVAGVLEWVTRIVDRFEALSPATQEWIGKLLLVSAALGPIAMFLGSMVRSAALLKMAFAGGAIAKGLSSLGGFAGAASVGASLAGSLTAGLAGAVALAAGLAITAGLDAGIKQAKANAAKNMGFWEDFWSTFVAVPKGIFDKANQVSTWLDEVLGGAGGQRRLDAVAAAHETLAQRITTAWGVAAQQLQYIKVDLEKAIAIPAINTALTSKLPQTKADLVKLRSVIVTELDITKREANKIMGLLFPSDWGKHFDKGAKDVSAAVGNLRTRIQTLRADMAKHYAFGDLKGGDKIKRQLDDLVSHYNKVKAKVDKANKDLGNATRYVSEGINKHSGGVKGATNRLVDFIQLPLGKMGPKFRKNSEDAMKQLGDGMDKSAVVAKKVMKAVNAAVKAGEISAKGAKAIGSALESGAASTITGLAMAGKMRAAVRAAISAGMAEAKAESPSKETMKLGRWMSEGLAIGITQKKAEAMAAAADVASSVVTIFDSMLQVGADIKGMKEQGLPSAKIAKAWATRVSRLIKAIYGAITKELGSLDLLDKETKNKKGDSTTIPGKGTKFTAIATLAGDIGGIFSAFTDMSVKSVTESMAALNVVRRNAKKIGRNIVGMARSMLRAMDGLFVSEFTGSNISRAVQIGSDIASVISAFVEITEDKVADAVAGLNAVRARIYEVAAYVLVIARVVKMAFAGQKVDEIVAGAASEAVQLATDIAGIISTFAEMTEEKIELAMAGMSAAVAFISDGQFLSNLRAIAGQIKMAFTNAKEDPIIAAAASEAVQLATDIAGIITTFAEITAATVNKAVAGLNATIGALPTIGPALSNLVTALRDTIGSVVVSPELAAAASASAQLVGDITGIINNLVGMTKKVIQDGIWGAGWVALKAVELGDALRKMVGWLAFALRGIDATSLGALKDSLIVLAEIAGAISGIVNDLAEMTSEKLSAATSAGESLGRGFYNGLLSWHRRIIDEASAIARETASALGGVVPGGTAGGSSSAAVPAVVYGTGAASRPSTHAAITDNSRITINLPPSLSPAQAQSIARSEIGAFEARKAEAKSAATRGMVRG